jgi:cytochrome c biogenesis protein CcdA
LSVSIGFAATFAVIWLVIEHLTRDVYEWGPWVSVVIGIALAALGVYLLSGRELRLRLPRLDVGGRTTGVRSMVLYGVSYAVVSIGCTMPLFSVYLTRTADREGFLSGVIWFASFAAGFTVLLVSLTLAVALARRSLVVSLRRVLPYVQRISGALLVIGGAYVAWYGWYERTRLGEEDAFVDRVTGWSADIQAWIDERGPTTIGLLLALVVAASAIFVLRRAR